MAARVLPSLPPARLSAARDHAIELLAEVTAAESARPSIPTTLRARCSTNQEPPDYGDPPQRGMGILGRCRSKSMKSFSTVFDSPSAVGSSPGGVDGVRSGGLLDAVISRECGRRGDLSRH